MKKITMKAAAAFENRKRFSENNTCVEICFCGGEKPSAKMYLFGNLIAELDAQGRLWIDSCGWQTSTTKERLNGLQGVSITQKNWKWYLNGREWNGGRVCVNDWGGRLPLVKGAFRGRPVEATPPLHLARRPVYY